MSADGTYGFVYRGATGLGIGVFTIRDNVVKGADWGGGRYSGTINERPNAEGYTCVFDLLVPAGMFLVQGVAPQELSHTRTDITIDLPLDFYNGEPIKRVVGPGSVTFMIQTISDDFSWHASGARVTIERL